LETIGANNFHMKKILIAAVLFVAAGLVTQRAEAQVRLNVNIGIGTPAYYCPPPPPRRVVVYDAPCPRPVVVAPAPVVVYERPYARRVVVVRDRDCDYRRDYYRGDRGRHEGWYKHGRDRYYRD
jgi:hypothetical protein